MAISSDTKLPSTRVIPVSLGPLPSPSMHQPAVRTPPRPPGAERCDMHQIASTCPQIYMAVPVAMAFQAAEKFGFKVETIWIFLRGGYRMERVHQEPVGLKG